SGTGARRARGVGHGRVDAGHWSTDGTRSIRRNADGGVARSLTAHGCNGRARLRVGRDAGSAGEEKAGGKGEKKALKGCFAGHRKEGRLRGKGRYTLTAPTSQRR